MKDSFFSECGSRAWESNVLYRGDLGVLRMGLNGYVLTTPDGKRLRVDYGFKRPGLYLNPDWPLKDGKQPRPLCQMLVGEFLEDPNRPLAEFVLWRGKPIGRKTW